MFRISISPELTMVWISIKWRCFEEILLEKVEVSTILWSKLDSMKWKSNDHLCASPHYCLLHLTMHAIFYFHPFLHFPNYFPQIFPRIFDALHQVFLFSPYLAFRASSWHHLIYKHVCLLSRFCWPWLAIDSCNQTIIQLVSLTSQTVSNNQSLLQTNIACICLKWYNKTITEARPYDHGLQLTSRGVRLPWAWWYPMAVPRVSSCF